MLTRRDVVGALGASAAAALNPFRAFAETAIDGWPNRAVRVISPTATADEPELPLLCR